MSRATKILLLVTLVLFTLACNFIDQRLNQVQDAAKTAEAIGTALSTAIPVETIQALPSALPMETLEALPSALPMETLEALPSEMPDFGNMFNPQGEPVKEWKGVPIMPQATAGQEQDANNYSFKFAGTVKEAEDFYNGEMGKLGWSPMFSMPGDANGAILVFQKDSSILTVTVISVDGGNTVVLLTTA